MTSSDLADLELFIKEMALAGCDFKTAVIRHYNKVGQYDHTTIEFSNDIFPLASIECREEYEVYPRRDNRIRKYKTFSGALKSAKESIMAYYG